MLLYSDWCIST